MPFLTSNRVLDILIISALFALIVTVSPVSSLPYYDVYLTHQIAGLDSSLTYSSFSFLDSTQYAGVGNLPTGMAKYWWRVSCTGSQQANSALSFSDTTFSPPTTGCYEIRLGSSPTYAFYYNTTSRGDLWVNGTITASFTQNTTSGYPPLTVQFTDTSVNTPTSWDWNFGDGTTHSTIQNPVHSYTTAGTYTVTLIASLLGNSSTKTQTNLITVTPYTAPVAAFSCTPTNTTSPAVITCTDSSSNTPTSWLWQLTSFGVSISPGGSYGAGIYSAVNSTQNPVFNMTGSGTVDVRLTATNPGGSGQNYKPSYITVSGAVPTPTPTPTVPWPNQTGICKGSAISLGSGVTRAHDEHYQLTSPYGDTFSGTYLTGVQNLVSGYPFFTALIGQYVYQETSLVNGTLEWQQSYIVEDCSALTTPPTGVPTSPVTTVPTFVTYTIPVVTITPYNYQGATPNTSINYGVTLPTSINLPTLPSGLPAIPAQLNETNIYNMTCSGSSPLVQIFCPITTYLRSLIISFNDTFMFIVWVPFGFISAILGYLTLALSSFSGAISIWSTTASLFTGIMWNSFQAIPAKALNALTVPLLGEFLKEMIDWPEDLQ